MQLQSEAKLKKSNKIRKRRVLKMKWSHWLRGKISGTEKGPPPPPLSVTSLYLMEKGISIKRGVCHLSLSLKTSPFAITFLTLKKDIPMYLDHNFSGSFWSQWCCPVMRNFNKWLIPMYVIPMNVYTNCNLSFKHIQETGKV